MLKELLKSRQITQKQYEEERKKLESEAWRALKELKEKYDKVFSDLEELIKALFRARKPLISSMDVPSLNILLAPIEARIIGLAELSGRINSMDGVRSTETFL